MFLESFKIAISSIFHNKARSFLTVLGVIIGVGSVILMLSLGEGVKKEVAEMVEGFGTNIIAIVPGKVEKGESFNPATTMGVSTLTEKDVDSIKERADKVRDVTPFTLIGGAINFDGKVSTGALVLSTTPSFNKITTLDLEEGRFISEENLEDREKVIVLGASIKEDLFGDNDPVGEIVKFRNIDFEIIGYTKKRDETFQFGDMDISSYTIIPRTTGIDITESDQIFRIAMEAKSSEIVDEAVSQVESIILENHQGTEDFSVLTQEDLLNIVGDILNLLTLLISSIAAISLVVGGIGIMNMMLVTVTERTREIGIRKAVGARNLDILVQFLIESVVVSFLGGFLGISLAFGLGFLVDYFVGISPVINLNFIILAFSISFAIGVIFGLAPAIRASRKDPIEALRYE